MTRPTRRLAVVTGGHPFDVPGFQALVQAATPDGCEAFIQHIDDLASSALHILQGYDAVLFYFFPLTGPDDEVPGQIGRPRWALERLIEAGTGLVVLHHALLAYPQWELWDQVVGCSGRSRFGYHGGQRLTVTIASAAHEITAGLQTWSMVDETYQMPEPAGTPLLQVDHPLSLRTLGWARHCGSSRVVCLQSGHDDASWATTGLRRFLRQGIAWAAAKPSQAGHAACQPAGIPVGTGS